MVRLMLAPILWPQRITWGSSSCGGLVTLGFSSSLFCSGNSSAGLGGDVCLACADMYFWTKSKIALPSISIPLWLGRPVEVQYPRYEGANIVYTTSSSPGCSPLRSEESMGSRGGVDDAFLCGGMDKLICVWMDGVLLHACCRVCCA